MGTRKIFGHAFSRHASSRALRHTFNFSKPRVKYQREDGEPRILDKFEIARMISDISYYKGLYAEDVYKYSEIKQLLLELLEERKFDNVIIIK